MSKIDKIIREEINRYILKETIDFNTLNTLSMQLSSSTATLRNEMANNQDTNINQFLTNLITYSTQITQAIIRCMRANNLNEGFGGLSSYGINLPGNLGGNLWQDAKQGWYNSYNFLSRVRNKFGKNQNTYNNTNTTNLNQTIKLSVLLSKLPEWQRSYNRQQNIINVSNEPYRMLYGIIPQIQNEYNTQMRNAQGTNP